MLLRTSQCFLDPKSVQVNQPCQKNVFFLILIICFKGILFAIPNAGPLIPFWNKVEHKTNRCLKKQTEICPPNSWGILSGSNDNARGKST